MNDELKTTLEHLKIFVRVCVCWTCGFFFSCIAWRCSVVFITVAWSVSVFVFLITCLLIRKWILLHAGVWIQHLSGLLLSMWEILKFYSAELISNHLDMLSGWPNSVTSEQPICHPVFPKNITELRCPHLIEHTGHSRQPQFLCVFFFFLPSKS